MGREGLRGLSTSESLTQNLAFEGDAWAPFLPPFHTPPTSQHPSPQHLFPVWLLLEKRCESQHVTEPQLKGTHQTPRTWGWRGGSASLLHALIIPPPSCQFFQISSILMQRV